MTPAPAAKPDAELMRLHIAATTAKVNWLTLPPFPMPEQVDAAYKRWETAEKDFAAYAAALAAPKGDAGGVGDERERGWLVELKSSVFTTPRYMRAIYEDENWTKDANHALRFARKKDAEAVIFEMRWTEAFASEHIWDDGRRNNLETVQHDNLTPAPARPAEGQVERVADALADLIEAVTAEVNEKGGGGYILARLSDARAALAAHRGG